MKEHKFNLNTFIGGWYINPKVCDSLVNYFNTNKDLIRTGMQGSIGSIYMNKKEKDSYEIPIDIHQNQQNLVL